MSQRETSPPRLPRGAGLIRTLVVATATLAILLVCFSIYQYSQLDAATQGRLAGPRLPDVPAVPSSADSQEAAPTPGVPLGQAMIGGGRDIRLSLYPPEGTRSALEIAVRSYTPVAGAADEFHLTDPEIRLRTTDGRAVRVTAREGRLEAQRRSSGLDPHRGRLAGDVTIEIDRLTEEQRQSLPPELAEVSDPSQVVRVEADAIEFDLKYSKIVIPAGRLHASASDFDFRASDMEVWFNEQEGRVDFLRITGGGRLELRELTGELDAFFPDSGAPRRFRLVEWIRHALEQSSLAQQSLPDVERQEVAEAPTAPARPEAVTIGEDGIPVFRPDHGSTVDPPKPPVRYFARFEKQVEVKRELDGVVVSQLNSDLLELLRAVTDSDRQRAAGSGAPGGAEGGPTSGAPPTSRKSVVVEWKDRLVVEACRPDDERCDETRRVAVMARGAPARLTGTEGSAECDTLRLNPESSEVWLDGTAHSPVRMALAEEGTVTGTSIHTQRRGDTFFARITGPGVLVRETAAASVDRAADAPRATEPIAEPGIRFEDELILEGRFVPRTRISLIEGVTTDELRVLDTATFRGGVVLEEVELTLSAEEVVASFGEPPAGQPRRQTLIRVQAEGRVDLQSSDDRITCRQIDVAMDTDAEGNVIPTTATALGDVEAVQKERLIRARDRVVVDFAAVARPAPPFDPMEARAQAIARGQDLTSLDLDFERRRHESSTRREVRVRRLRASGEVSVSDPSRQLDVQADELDCFILDGEQIERAFLLGTDEAPAHVRLENFTVTGASVKVHVPDQWAQVPGAGRMTFLSSRDLDGRKLTTPVPVVITWQDWMKYQGRENRSVFSGSVHITSRDTTTFDAAQLLVEFEDVAREEPSKAGTYDWWIFEDLVAPFTGSADRREAGLLLGDSRVLKEPMYILATGKAVAQTAQHDPDTGSLATRARLEGPRLSVNLRPDVSKMLIEGQGSLLLEDFRSPSPDESESARAPTGLLTLDEQAGPSKTLIQWHESMWYDFSIYQTRFDGSVSLKHISGAALEELFGRQVVSGGGLPRGRATFLTCDVLTVDFLDRLARRSESDSPQLGGLSAERLRQFQANGSVTLQDQTEGLSLQAQSVVFEKQRNLVQVYGTAERLAHIVIQRRNENPHVFYTERFFYDLVTHQGESSRPIVIPGR